MKPKAQGYSTKFEDHKGLLHMIARRCFGRAIAAGIVTDYEDVYAEMCVGFTKAARGYDPTRGITFTAYCGRVCWNHFNKVMEKEVAAGPKLGLVRFEDMQVAAPVMCGYDNDSDILEYLDLDTEDDEEGGNSPEDVLDRKQQFVEQFRALSPVTRRYVAYMIGYRRDPSFSPTIEERKVIRQEVEEVYGVTISKIRL